MLFVPFTLSAHAADTRLDHLVFPEVITEGQVEWIDITTETDSFAISIPATKQQIENAVESGANINLDSIFWVEDPQTRVEYGIASFVYAQAYCQHVEQNSGVITWEATQDTYTTLRDNGQNVTDFGWPFSTVTSPMDPIYPVKNVILDTSISSRPDITAADPVTGIGFRSASSTQLISCLK